jgi:small-conductance mechanosensitive channel
MSQHLGAAFTAIQQDAEDADASTSEAETTVDVVCGNSGALCESLYEWTGNELLAEATSFIVGVPVKIVTIIAVALIVNRILRRAIGRLTDRLGTVTADYGDAVVTERNVERARERASTIGSLLRSLTSAFVFGAALIMILETIGIGVVAVIASAGVLGLAIGFGAQSVVEDLLRGVFMLGEDQFGVGDRVDVGTVNGYVERVTLRTAVIRDTQGTLWHIPNSQINWVANENQLRSRATVAVGVSYSADLDAAMRVLDHAARDAAAEPEWQDVVTEEPQVQGVQELGDDAVNIRVIVWVDAGARRRFERHLRQRLKEALDQAGVEMPNRQVDVWLRDRSLPAADEAA